MQRRREFLKRMGLMTTAGLEVFGSSSKLGASRSSPKAPGKLLSPDTVLKLEEMKVRGTFSEATVPDTLDLADRARLAINAMTHLVDPETWYYDVQVVDFGPKGALPKPRGGFDITAEFARSIPWMRTMCGSEDFLDREYGMMKAMLSNVRKDGLVYYPVSAARVADSSYPDVNGTLALACELHYMSDGNAEWLEWIRHLATGLDKAAIRVEDRAYFPPECTIDPDGKWHWNLRGKSSNYHPPEEPTFDTQGYEGCVKYEQGAAMRTLVRACTYFKNEESAKLLNMLTRFCMKPGLWVDTSKTRWEGYKGNEHGIWCCHFHGNTWTLLALLDVAELQKNSWLKEVVREGYDHGIRNGAVRFGWFPSGPGEIVSEPDAVGEMIELGVRLSDAGLGEYWDDVDATVRNHLAASQWCDLDGMRRLAKGGPMEDRVPELLGGYYFSYVTAIEPRVAGCCTANGSTGLYYAWHGITRFNAGIATVNLFLNRATRWMDVDSYLPYEGKVELHNKEAKMALVRIPNWVDIDEVKSSVNGRMTRPGTSRRYLIFDGLRKGDTIKLEFPNPETTDEYTIGNGVFHPEELYQVAFRGSTVVNIEPKMGDPGHFTLYDRNHLFAKQAPLRKTKRFIAENILPLQ